VPQNDVTPVVPLGRTCNDPVPVTIGLGVGGQANDSGPSVGLFDKVLFLAIPEIELRPLVNKSRVRVER